MEKYFEKVLFGGILFFLGCYFAKLFNMHNLVSVALGMFFCVVLLIKQKKIRIDIATGLLVITIAMYFIRDMNVMKTFTSHYFYEVMMIYVLGHYVAFEIKSSDNCQKKFEWLLIIFIIAITSRGILNSCMFLTKQWLNGNFRVWKDFWTGEFINGTMQVLYYIPALAVMAPAIIFYKKNKSYHTMMILSAVFLLYVSVVSQSRTSVVMLPVVAVIQVILHLLMDKRGVERYLNKKNIIILTSIGLGCLLVVSLFLITTSAGRAFIEAMGRQGGILNNIRFRVQREALEQIFVYPMGGKLMNLSDFEHAHNLWLDIADVGGVIPFFTFGLYTVVILFEVLLFVNKSNQDIKQKLIIIGLHVAYMLFFTIEPGLHWHVSFITPWIFINGLVHGYVKEEKSC